MKLIRTSVPYSQVERLDTERRYWDWETKDFDPPYPGAVMVSREWDTVGRSCLITWLVEGPTDWSPALALPSGKTVP